MDESIQVEVQSRRRSLGRRGSVRLGAREDLSAEGTLAEHGLWLEGPCGGPRNVRPQDHARQEE